MKNKMKMRLISFMLCFVMLVGLMPTTAFAAEKEIIDSISATVTLPTAGAHPVETGIPGDSSYKIVKVSFSEKDAETGLYTSLGPTDTFEEGKTYMVNVLFRANSGYAIDRDTVSASINGQNATWWSTISDGYDSKYFYIEYTVPEEITNFSVRAFAPVAGETADTRGIAINSEAISVTSAEWCALRDDVGLVSVNKFTAGKTYYLIIKYDVAEGYAVSNNANILHNLSGGEVLHNSSTKTIMIEYTVVAEAPKTSITSVKISDVTEPVIGATPDFDITITGTGAALYEYDEEEWEAIIWDKLDPETGEWEPMDEDTLFGAGIYCIGVALEPEDGYEFTDATKFYYNEYELPEYDGSYESNYERWSGGVDIYLYFTVEEPAAPTEKITSLSATVTAPMIGASPFFEAVVGGEGYTAELEWEIVAEEAIIYPEDDYKFKAGEEYGLWIVFIPEDGYEFADDVTIMINGITPEDAYVYEDEIVGLVTYTLPAATPITSVKVSDVTEPVIGATPDFDITLTGDGVAFDEEEGNGYAWWKVEAETRYWQPMDEDTPFGAGLYVLGVYLKSDAGYEFAEDTKIYFGEKELPEYDGSHESNYELWGEEQYADIYLYFTVEEPAVTTHTVSFDANGGTGSMADVTGVSGEYTLPENGFTAPEGMQFKAWSVDGDEKAVGDKITMTANVTVKAIWEALPEETPTEVPTQVPTSAPTPGNNTVTPAPDTYTIGGFIYKITSAENKTVELCGTTNKKLKKLNVKATVTIDGAVYKVTSIGKAAFKNIKTLKALTLGKNVTTIGNKAFFKCKALKKVVIKAKKLKKVGAGAFKKTNKKMTLKAPKKLQKKYKKLIKK